MTDSSPPQTLDQCRARFAWGKAADGRRLPGKDSDTYRAVAKGAPALIIGSGLMPTLAFLESKSKDGAHARLRSHLCEWLALRFQTHEEFQPASSDYVEVMDRLHRSSSAFYMEATSELLEVLKWIRQYVDAVPEASENSQ